MKINETFNTCIYNITLRPIFKDIVKDYITESYNIIYNPQSESELKEIVNNLKVNNKKYLLITDNIEYAIYSDYLLIMDKEEILLEGQTKSVLQEEKVLKRLGVGLPFLVDLSTQLKHYEVLDDIYFDSELLIGTLWK